MSAFPSLKIAFEKISGQGRKFYPQNLQSKEFIEDFMLEVDDKIADGHDPICSIIKEAISKNEYHIVSRYLLSELYRIGAVSLKMSANETFLHSHKDTPIIKASSISQDTKINIHPMLHRALNIDKK